MSTQLDLLSPVEPYYEPTRDDHHAQYERILLALLAEGARGLSGEEAALRCRIDPAHGARTRLNDMRTGKHKDFPVPLVYRSEKRERPTASGRPGFVYWLTDAGRIEAENLRRSAA